MFVRAAVLCALVASPALALAGSTKAAPVAPAEPPVRKMELTVESKLGFEETINKLKEAAAEVKFSVQGTHEISKVLNEKGFPRDPVTVLEVCNAKLASEFLKADVRMATMMPCPLAVYVREGKVFVTTLDPKQMVGMYGITGLDESVAALDKGISTILAAVKK